MRREGTTTLLLAFAYVVVLAPALRAQDLSVYRQFRLGGQEQDQRRSLAAGVDHHMVKPLDIDKLGELLRTGQA